MMPELQASQKISAYVAENRTIEALEAEVKYMAIKANEKVFLPEGPGKDFDPEPPNAKEEEIQNQRLDSIYDDDPLGFEKDPLVNNIKMLVQDPLEEIDMGEGLAKRPTYISTKIYPELKIEMIHLLKEFKDFFA